MKLETLLELIPDNYTFLDKEMVQKAYEYANNVHNGQKRASGEPYINHCTSVAAILAELNVPPAVLIAGLLHDTVEDTDTTLDDIEKNFGEEIMRLVDGVTKLSNLPRVSKTDQHNKPVQNGVELIETDEDVEEDTPAIRSSRRNLSNETLRKVFLAMGDDIRVVLIKLADRLHNMRTLGYMPENKRKRIAQETLDIFTPLANRLGIWQVKWELEDLAFRYVNPEKFREIASNIALKRKDRETEINSIIANLKNILNESKIDVEITGRSKHIYSIYKKMAEKDKPFEMVMDLRAVRLIVPDIPSCYAALGVIHTHWRPIPHEFDDYIAAPKDNFYQSIHTAILYEDGKPLEVQIRTQEMHQNAEFGIAAHWRYKERGPRDKTYEQRINWLRRLMEWKQEVEDAQEFVDSMKSDVFQDRVYVFTPRGDIIDLPAGATPIDFAYHVHTEIGHRCRGAKVNGKLVSLDYSLKTGDQLEILTSKQGGPSRDWLNPNLGLVKTQRTRSKIRNWFKKQDHDQNASHGKLILEKEVKKLGLKQIDFNEYAATHNFRNIDELYVALGCGDLSISKIIRDIADEEESPEDPLFISKDLPDEPIKSDSVTVLGLKGLLTVLARCCKPAPGDEIVGYITRGRGATIHRADCPNILRTNEKERIVKVSWGELTKTYPVAVQIKAYDRQGLVGDISNVISNEGGNLLDITLKVSHNLATFKILVEVSDINQLSKLLTRIETLPNVMEAYRMRTV